MLMKNLHDSDVQLGTSGGLASTLTVGNAYNSNIGGYSGFNVTWTGHVNINDNISMTVYGPTNSVTTGTPGTAGAILNASAFGVWGASNLYATLIFQTPN